jgi:purine-binding chemotaxis protein CheW
MFSSERNPAGRALLFRAAGHTCALNLAHVVEIMRPLPVEPLAGAPETVRGLSAIRAVPVPVVELGALFSAAGGASGRFVVVRTGGKQVALAVDEVLGICDLAASVEQAMPPLLRDAVSGAIDTIAALDTELYLVLNAARIVPDGRWLPPAVEER